MSVTNSKIQLPTEGTGPNTATFTKTEDSVTKHLSRVCIEHPDASLLGQCLKPTSGGCMPVDGAGQTAAVQTKPGGVDAFVTKTADFTASQTGISLWDPGAGNRFIITSIIISFSAAGAFTLFDGTDSTTYRVCKINGAANGGMVCNYTQGYKSAALANILKYTTGAGAAGSITVTGYVMTT